MGCSCVEMCGRFGGTFRVRRKAGYEIKAARAVTTPHAVFTVAATRTSSGTRDT